LPATYPTMPTIMAIMTFSLAGLPPLGGVWAEWYVFRAAIDAQLYWLAVIGVLTSVVGAFFDLRIIKVMWFDEAVGAVQPMAGKLRFVLWASGAFVLFYVFIGGPVGQLAEAAARTFF